MNWRVLVYPIAAFPLIASAETHYLLVDPGASPVSNYYRFYNEVRRAYESLRAVGKTPKVIAKDGTWRLKQQLSESLSSFALTSEGVMAPVRAGKTPSYPPITGSARNAQDFINGIKAMDLKDGDSLVLYINGHGGAPRNPNDPSTATIQAWDSEFEFNQLTGALKSVAQRINIKLVATTCYGGGIHSISRDLPNVCSASITNQFSEGSSGDLQEGRFNKGLWQNFIDSQGRTSFAEANLAGFRNDDGNLNLGRLSSFDYVDYILKRGPYEKVWPNAPDRWLENGTETTLQFFPNEGYSPVLPADALVLSFYNPLWAHLDQAGSSDGTCYTNPIQADLDRIARLSTVLSGITEDTLKENANSQPRELRTVFHDVIDDMKKNGQNYLETARRYDTRYRELVARWNEHKNERQNSWATEGDIRARMQREFDDLKRAAESDLKKFSFNHQMLDRLERLDEFNKKATSAQKQKFIQLLRCEWEPL